MDKRLNLKKMKAYIINQTEIDTRQKPRLKVNESYEGERIEQKIERITVNKEPITDGAPIVYTERADGVRPEYDIRTDKWDIAIDAMGVIEKTHKTRRQEAIDKRKAEKEAKEKGTQEIGKTESTQGTSEK